MATVEKLTIEFGGKGSRKLTGQLNAMSAAMNRLAARQIETTKQTKKTNKGLGLLDTKTKRNGKSLNNLGLAFSTVRSKMLLFNFAMALRVSQLIKFAKEAAKVEAMARGFNTLTGATEDSSLALEKLKEATNGTMSEFDLFQQANNAMILGVSKNSDEMAEMFDIAQRLGRVLGKDTKTSIESLVTGIGRQSRLMLDNIGIITKVDDANKAYARTLKKNVSELTDSEKKQAFLNATMEAAREKVALLGAEVETTQDKMDSFDAAMSDLSANIGQALGVAFLPLMRAMVKVSEAMSVERVRAYATVIVGTLVAAMALYVSKLKQAALWQTKLGWGALATAAGFVAGEILVMSGAFKDAEENIDLSAQKAESLAQALIKLSLAELIHQQQVLTAIVSDSFDPFSAQIALIDKYIAILEKGFSNIENFNDALRQSEELYKKTPKAQRELIEAQIEMIENLIKVNGESSELVAVLEMLEGKLNNISTVSPALLETIGLWGEYQKAVMGVANAYEEMKMQGIENDREAELSAANNIKWERKRQKKIDDINDKYDKEAKKQKEEMRDIKIAEAISNTALGITKSFSDPGGIAGWIMAGLIEVQGAMQVATIKAQKYQYGGMVGGNRHSQGGTIIEAERGVYVISRQGVESAGIEALNRINAGAGGGSVNISFNGNVLSKDFIEDEAIPQIKEAIRRGADIGVG